MRLALKPEHATDLEFKLAGSSVNELIGEIRSLSKTILSYYGREIKKNGLSIQVEKEYLGYKPSYPIVIRKKIKKGWFRHEWVLVSKSYILDNYLTDEHQKRFNPYTLYHN